MPVKIFFCYAHEDETLLTELKKHLKPLQLEGLVEFWHDRDISAGMKWEQQIKDHLNSAQIILLLISPDFMASDYINNVELKRALERDEQGEARVIPVILRHAYWEIPILQNLQALPNDAKPIRSWSDPDEAFFNVTEGIRKVVKELMAPFPDLPSPLPPPEPQPPLDIITQAKSLEKQFQANDYKGTSNGEPLILINGSIPVVLSCPRAVAYYIRGKRYSPHLYTGALTMQIAERTNSNALIYARTTDEVPAWGKEGSYKRQLTNLIQNSHPFFVLDIQGSHKSIQGDVLIGTIGEKSLLDKPYLLDILKGILRKAGLTNIVIDRPDFTFDAKEKHTVTNYTSEKHNTPAMQITIARKYRNVDEAPQDYMRLLNTLSNAVIEMYKACEGKH